MQSTETYIAQVFASFAPSDANPLLLRLEEGDTFAGLIRRALTKYTELKVAVTVPTSDPADYAVVAAAGDGSPLPTSSPFRPDTIVRTSGLEFPYMLNLTYVPPSAEGAKLSASTPVASVGAAVIAAEKEAREAHAAKINELRELRVQEIERRQAEKEKKHFQHCESYEVYRREAAEQQKKKKQEAEKKAEALAQAKALRQEVAEEESQEKEQSLLQVHRQAMEAKLAETKNRQLAMARQREEAAEAAAEKKREFDARLKAERESERDARLRNLSDRLLDQLHARIEVEQQQVEESMEMERARRQGEERAVLELRGVVHLEQSRTIVKDDARHRRLQIEAAARAEQEKLEQTVVEEERQARADEEQRYLSWKAERSRQLEADESALELKYRAERTVTSPST